MDTDRLRNENELHEEYKKWRGHHAEVQNQIYDAQYKARHAPDVWFADDNEEPEY